MKTRYSLIALGALMALSQAALAQRGSSGHVNVIYWQAPSILNPYLSGGTKDLEASSLILDPLVKFNEKGEMVAALVESVPTVANGGFAADFKSITYKLKRGLKWADGSPLTAQDVLFTYEYCTGIKGCAKANTNKARLTNHVAKGQTTSRRGAGDCCHAKLASTWVCSMASHC